MALVNLVERTDEINEITGTTSSDVIDLHGASSITIQCIVDVNTPSAKTFDGGGQEVTTLTFDTQANTDAGDYVVIYDTEGNGWAVAADLTGSDPEPTGAIWTAIPAARKGQADLSAATDAASVAAAFELAFDALTDVPFATDDTANDGTMIITVTLVGTTTDAVVKNEDDSGAGSISEAQTDQGVATEIDLDEDSVTIPSHGFFTGLKGQLTTTGTLPAGVTTATDYFVIVVDANTIQFAASLADALAGTEIDLTDYGSDEGVHTFTPTSLAGATVKMQKTNVTNAVDLTVAANWSDHAAATSITADGTVWLEDDAPNFRYARLQYTLTAGSMSTSNYILVKGQQ